MARSTSPQFNFCNPAQLNSAEKIDEAIEKFEAELRMLRQLQNDNAPINCRLPVEILTEIFLHLAYQCSELYSRSRQLIRYDDDFVSLANQWVRVTHVCRHWRNIALAFPRPWSLIARKHPKSLSVFLERSSHSPLELRPHHHDKWYKKAIVSMVHNNAHRLRILELDIPFSFEEAFSASAGAPLLEELSLRDASSTPLNPSSLHFLLRDASSTPVDPSSWQSLVFPRLRKADLSGRLYSSLRYAIPQTTLTHLTIRGLWSGTENLHDLINDLGTLQSLETLHLYYVMGRHTEIPSFTSHQVSFPHMRLLHIEEEAGVALAISFLGHVILPSSTDIFFKRTALHWHAIGSYSNALEVLRARILNDASAPTRDITSCRLAYDKLSHEAVIEAFHTEAGAETLAASGDITGTPLFTFKWGVWSASHAATIIRFFFDTFPLAGLRTLNISGVQSQHVVQPLARWKTFADLRELWLEDIPSMPALHKNTGANQHFGHPPKPLEPLFLFPKLCFLRFCTVRWRRHLKGRPFIEVEECPPRDLVAILRERKDAGFPLKKLCIDTCHNFDWGEEQELVTAGFVETAEISPCAECSTCGDEGYVDNEDEDEDEDASW